MLLHRSHQAKLKPSEHNEWKVAKFLCATFVQHKENAKPDIRSAV